jgi:type IV pilus assembly protein PilF
MMLGDNNKYSYLIVILSCLLVISGCVTTERGSMIDKADDAKALEVSVQLARNYIRDGNWGAAKRHLKVALELDKDNAETYEALALVFQNTGEFEFAEENYKKSLSLNGDASRVRNNYGAFLFQLQRYDEAAEQLERVVVDTLYPQRLTAFISLGRCYTLLGKYEDARDQYRRAYLMNRNDHALAFELADVHFLLEDYVTSQQYYDLYRKGTKKQPARALWLGIRLADKFNNANAMSSYSLALKNLYPVSKEYVEYQKVFGNE